MSIRTNALRRVLAAGCVAGSAALLSCAGLAHDGHGHAAPMGQAGATGQAGPMDHAAHMDHSQHGAQVAGAGKDDYKRSMRSYSIPDVVLTDADARPVRLRELLAGRDPVMLNFIFTTCGTICPVMTKIFSDVPGRLAGEAKRLRMISISIDPENDTPAQLKSYSRKFEAGARWQFLTGRVQDINTVQRAFDSYRGDKMNHEPVTLLRAAPDQPWVRIDGFASPDALVREYHKVVLN